MPTIKFYTLGCKVNQYDTQSIRERFIERGFKVERPKIKSDFYLINTCTVTAIADQKSSAAIRRCINENPKAKVIVTGCMVKKDIGRLAEIKGLSLIIAKSFFNEGISDFCSHTRAFLKIQDGCSNFCAYCKVPLVRGRSRSRPLEKVEAEARKLAKKGFKEVVLTGICLGAYGRDLYPRTDLVAVINALEKISGIERIRLSSIEAGDVTRGLIAKIAGSKKLCPHLHIPIQSGDDEILKKMRRSYTRSFYLGLIRKLGARIPHLAITTDCLIGFPGEEERHFRQTLDLVKQIQPLKVHIFPYSARAGTLAALKTGSAVQVCVLKERIRILEKAADASAKAYRKKFLGKKVTVLFESRSKEAKGCWEGYSENYIKVLYNSKRNLKNKLVRVRLDKFQGAAVRAS